ncbi:Late embryogenesis abundant protein [Thalictrum thalictroides]|uniref:Late embryogenesis abundant protein n=1 Tax=Thalictrum thalictroides TaxID=46969 RepID=A0A7J6UWY4_THATH|nr:Late embryogenesis abundant protein [Thalictrum thalictroides]
MQSNETPLLGHTLKGGPAVVMQSAATRKERTGVVGHKDLTDIAAGDQGMTAVETNLPGKRINTESVAGQVVGKCTEDVPMEKTPTADIRVDDKITIGEALEVSALTAGEKPVDQSDAAAIQAAEVSTTHSNVIIPGGVAAMAQSAANVNARMGSNEDKTKLADILTDANTKLPGDKPVTRQDAEGVMVAELRNNPNLATHPGGVGASVVAAARINQRNK